MSTSSLGTCRRKQIAASVIALFALSAPLISIAGSVSVCTDSIPGSLRAVVATAHDGDTIDMTQLTCSTISLTDGAISTSLNNLTFTGPGQSLLLITGKNSPKPDRIFNHTGTGNLKLYGMSIAYGALTNSSGDALGGCVYSSGNVLAFDVSIGACTAQSTQNFGFARGGGMFVRGNLTMKYAKLNGNSALSGSLGVAYGGGAVVYGNFSGNIATVSNNYARSDTSRDLGGGLELPGNSATFSITASTISGNRSNQNVGGIAIPLASINPYIRIVNSTISGNIAKGSVGGMSAVAPTKTLIYNSTIAFNTSGSAPAGVVISAFSSPTQLNLQSSVFSNNTYGTNTPIEDDLEITSNEVAISGNNNLIRVSSSAGLPSDTIVSACPLLGPLQNNGGPTLTHALLSQSPAIAKGNNSQNLTYDQRGSQFTRISAAPPGGMAPTVPDIGAYEVQQNDIVFNAGFDGCP